MFDEKKEKVIEFNKEEFLKFLENKIKKYFQIMSINEISGSDFETLTIKNIIDKKTDKCFNLDLKIYRTKYYRGDEIINLQPEYVEVSNFYYNHESNKKYEKLKKDKTSKLKKTNIFEKTNKNPEKIKSIVILNQDSFIGHLNKTEGLRICDDNYSKTKTCFIKDNEKIKGLNFENIMLKKLQKSLNKNKDFKDNYDITIKNIMGTDDNLNDFTCDLTITLFKNKDEDIKDIKKIKEILKQIIKYEKNNKLKNSEKDDFVKQYINLKKEIEKFLGKELTEDTLKNDKSVDLFLKQLFKNIRYYLKNPQTNKFQTKIENKKYIDLLNKPISIDEQNYLQGFKTDSLDIIYLDKNNFKTIHELKNENKNNETGETTPFEILEFSSEEKKLSNELLKAVRENFQLFLKEEFSFFEEKSKTYTVNLNNSNYQINFKTEKIKDVNMLNNILKLNYTILNNIFKLSIKINRLNNNNISFDEKYLNNRLIIPKVFLTNEIKEKIKQRVLADNNYENLNENHLNSALENKMENALTQEIKRLNLKPINLKKEQIEKIEEELKNLNLAIDEKNKQINKPNSNIYYLRRLKKIPTEIKNIEENIALKEKELTEKELKKLTKNKELTEKELKKLTKNIEKLKEELKELKEEKKELEKEEEQIKENLIRYKTEHEKLEKQKNNLENRKYILKKQKKAIKPTKITVPVRIFNTNYEASVDFLYLKDAIFLENFSICKMKEKTSPYDEFVNNIATNLIRKKEKTVEKKEETKSYEIFVNDILTDLIRIREKGFFTEENKEEIKNLEIFNNLSEEEFEKELEKLKKELIEKLTVFKKYYLKTKKELKNQPKLTINLKIENQQEDENEITTNKNQLEKYLQLDVYFNPTEQKFRAENFKIFSKIKD